MKFITKNSAHSAIHIVYTQKNIEQTVNTNFLGLQIDNHRNWREPYEGNDA